WRGAVPYEQLRDEAVEADVLVMPYADLPVTRAMQPLKLKEYLATSLPVVATPLPANLPWAEAMDIASSPSAFVAACIMRAHIGTTPAQIAARRRLEDESWSRKAARFAQLITGAPPADGR